MNESRDFKVSNADLTRSPSLVTKGRTAMQSQRSAVNEMTREAKINLIQEVRKAAQLLVEETPGNVQVSLLPNDEYGEVYWLQLLSCGSETFAIRDGRDAETFVTSMDLRMADIDAMFRWLRAKKAVLAGFHVHNFDISVPLYGNLVAVIETRLDEYRRRKDSTNQQ